jgi:hypothetical protein
MFYYSFAFVLTKLQPVAAESRRFCTAGFVGTLLALEWGLGNFAIDGAVIDQNFVDRLRIVELLEDVSKWNKPLGFYLTRGLGHRFWRRDNRRTCNQAVMSGRIRLSFVDFPAILFAFDRVRRVLMRPFLVRNWCGMRAHSAN